MSTHQNSTIDTSKYDCFVTFNVSFVDTGYDISTRPYSSYSVKFKYSDMGYPGICRCCTCIQVRIYVLMNSVNLEEKLSLWRLQVENSKF